MRSPRTLAGVLIFSVSGAVGCSTYDEASYRGTAPLAYTDLGFPLGRLYRVDLGEFDVSKPRDVTHTMENLPPRPMNLTLHGPAVNVASSELHVQVLTPSGLVLMDWKGRWGDRAPSGLRADHGDHWTLVLWQKPEGQREVSVRIAIEPEGFLSTGETLHVSLAAWK